MKQIDNDMKSISIEVLTEVRTKMTEVVLLLTKAGALEDVDAMCNLLDFIQYKAGYQTYYYSDPWEGFERSRITLVSYILNFKQFPNENKN